MWTELKRHGDLWQVRLKERRGPLPACDTSAAVFRPVVLEVGESRVEV